MPADSTPAAAKPRKINLRTPGVMARVQEQVESHYRSVIVERIRANGGTLTVQDTTLRLAKQFGFCYGVERAIDLAYAARKVFAESRLFILGEIIHNPLVNEQIAAMGIKNLLGTGPEAEIEDLTAQDVVIVPAFGTDLITLKKIQDRGCQIVDTTCGDVMSVWKRVRQNATEQVTSIIHGKAEHEETKATASRALGLGGGHYLIVLTLKDTDYVCDYIRHGGKKKEFLARFKDAYSRGSKSFRFFDTICGATQERQDALGRLLQEKMNLLLVVGGYNSSNTSHLAEMGEEKLPTYFIRSASKLESAARITHYYLHEKREIVTENWL